MYYATDLVARYNVLTTACTYTIYSYVSYIVCSLKSWIQPGPAHFPSCMSMCTETWNNIVLPTVNSNLQPGLNIIDKLEVNLCSYYGNVITVSFSYWLAAERQEGDRETKMDSSSFHLWRIWVSVCWAVNNQCTVDETTADLVTSTRGLSRFLHPFLWHWQSMALTMCCLPVSSWQDLLLIYSTRCNKKLFLQYSPCRAKIKITN